MYLTYYEYLNMGGDTSLTHSGFDRIEREAEYIIKSQAGGRTGERIAALPVLPQSVKDCMFSLVELCAKNTPCTRQTVSESMGAVSKSYKTASDTELSERKTDIVETFLLYTGLLYRGAEM